MPCSATEKWEERGRGNGGGVSIEDEREEAQRERGRQKKKLSEDERIERREDGKPNQFFLAVIPIRGQS